MSDKNRISGKFAGKIHGVLLFRALLRGLPLIISCAVLAGVAGYVWGSLSYRPVYQTTTTFVVTANNGSSASSYSNLTSASNLASHLSVVLKSDTLKNAVKEDLNTDSFNANLAASVISDTNLIVMGVSAYSAKDAYQITESVLKEFNELTDIVMNDVTFEVLQRPTVPVVPNNRSDASSRAKRYALIAAALVTLTVLAIAQFRDTVKTEDEVEKKLDTSLIVSVGHERKHLTVKDLIRNKDTSILLTNPTVSFGFVETFKRIRIKIEHEALDKGKRIILITSFEEDEGKSTVAANLAMVLGRKYRRVLIIDADLKKPALHKLLGYEGNDYVSIGDLLKGKTDSDSSVIIKDEEKKIHALVGVSGESYSSDLLSGERMAQLLAMVAKSYDAIIIDSPPLSAGNDTENLADLADASVLVVRQDYVPARILNDAIDHLRNSRSELLGCVLNNVKTADISELYSYGDAGGTAYSRYGYSRGSYGSYGYGSSSGSDSEAESQEKEGDRR
ncbi:MAG: polysaccharide biosynthesis tyrosine autokinase [Clostridia bacterium]|nr:polysaccharide biosynthesis tyrosine autokinase [Clostridia bacterium]